MSLALQIARTALLKPQPGDVLVVTMNRDITDGEAEVLRKRTERALSAHPGISILIVGRHDRVVIEAKVPDETPVADGKKPDQKTEAKSETSPEAPEAGEAATEAPTAAPAGDSDAAETATAAEGVTAKPQRRRSTGGKKAAKAAAGTKAGA